jgi:hypothetical protein
MPTKKGPRLEPRAYCHDRWKKSASHAADAVEADFAAQAAKLQAAADLQATTS